MQCAGWIEYVVAIATRGFFVLALKSNGKVVAWGRNDHGQCSVPGDLTNAVAVAAGFSLQTSTNLKVANSWSVITNSLQIGNGQITVTNPTTCGQHFYRLEK